MDIKDFLKQFKFKPNDLLGQNFLINEIVLQDIADLAELTKNDQVLEIGPGIGNLTKLLSERAGEVLAIEKDERYFPILHEVLGDALQSHTQTSKSSANVKIVFGDALKFNFGEHLKPGYKVVANIPYYITGKIIELLVNAKVKPSQIIILVQKEVAERVVAEPGSLSILAISVQLHAKVRIALKVPKENFYPTPKVDSAVLILDMYPKPLFDIEEKKFFKIVKAAFLGKRKQLHNTLKNNLGIPEEQVMQTLEKLKIKSTSRPQELTLEQWHGLYKELNML